jgi:hypothetical protein
MTTKDIRTSHAHTVCDVCGRTLLRGERAEIYINGGARRSVCELCRPRALHEGWVREGTLPDYSQSGAGSERHRSLLNRLRNRRRGPGRPSLDDELAGYDPAVEPRRRSGARPRLDQALTDKRWEAAAEPSSSDEPDPPYRMAGSPAPHRADPPEEVWGEQDGYAGEPDADYLDAEPRFYEDPEDELAEAPPPGPAPRSRRPWSRAPRSLGQEPATERAARQARGARRSRNADQAELTGGDRRGREPRHVRAVPAGEAQKIAAAVDLFNQSEHRRTVAGVARSLGGAGVAVLPATEPPSLVHIVVWWELCWYRYTVDLSDSVPGVRVDGQGYELSELTEAERSANAAADESGQLILR